MSLDLQEDLDLMKARLIELEHILLQQQEYVRQLVRWVMNNQPHEVTDL